MYIKKELIKEEVNKALDNAEKIWKEVGYEFLNESIKMFSKRNEIPSRIPGYPFIEEGKPKVSKFIALVLDIRDSTTHLTQAISSRIASASQLERVLYEITAINTAGAIIVDNYEGGITEFLGDGFLALYNVSNPKEPKELYKAYNSAKSMLNIGLPVINEIIKNRYSLPELKIGIGMAYSKAIVTIVGYGKNIHPKALGECVFRASKLSSGSNTILIDDRLENLWPSTKEGNLRFVKKSFKNIDFSGYEIETVK